MFDLKIVVTVIVTLLLLAGFLGTNEAVGGFFGSVGDKFSFPSSERDVSFVLSADNYSDISFTAKNLVNITIEGDTRASLKTGNLQTNKTLSVYGFQGTGSIKENTATLDGKIAKVELPEIAVAVQETLSSTSDFTSLSASNIEVPQIILNGNGELVIGNTTTRFSGQIQIDQPAGTLQINKDGHVFHVSGKASRISIPQSGIVIG